MESKFLNAHIDKAKYQYNRMQNQYYNFNNQINLLGKEYLKYELKEAKGNNV
tara:strand:+ start:795 stop:950 length:156 start_codon:yes stop_codon:yes gene_type:complete